MFDNYRNVKEFATEVMHLNDRFEKSLEKIKSFNEREVVFKQSLSEYDDLNQLLKDFEPYHKLWELAMEFEIDKQDYYLGAFLKLNYQNIEKKVMQYYVREINKLIKIFSDDEDELATSIAKEMKADVDRFREKMWLIELLTIEAMVKKLGHWKDLWRECGIQNEIEPNDEMTLQVLIDNKLTNFKEIIEEISKRAEK